MCADWIFIVSFDLCYSVVFKHMEDSEVVPSCFKGKQRCVGTCFLCSVHSKSLVKCAFVFQRTFTQFGKGLELNNNWLTAGTPSFFGPTWWCLDAFIFIFPQYFSFWHRGWAVKQLEHPYLEVGAVCCYLVSGSGGTKVKTIHTKIPCWNPGNALFCHGTLNNPSCPCACGPRV